MSASGETITANQILTAKRLKGEMQKLEKEREAYYQVVQDEKDPLLFYFLLRGASDSAYKGGYYIGKIVLPKDYPTNPGDFYMLTPSGRFEVNKKICLTNSGYHKESWTPMWNIMNMVIGFVSVFLSDTTTGISHIKETPAERKTKAANSMNYNLANHKDICKRFDQFVKPDGTVRTDAEVEQYVQEKVGKFKKPKKGTESAKDDMAKVVKKTKDDVKTVDKTGNKSTTKADTKPELNPEATTETVDKTMVKPVTDSESQIKTEESNKNDVKKDTMANSITESTTKVPITAIAEPTKNTEDTDESEENKFDDKPVTTIVTKTGKKITKLMIDSDPKVKSKTVTTKTPSKINSASKNTAKDTTKDTDDSDSEDLIMIGKKTPSVKSVESSTTKVGPTKTGPKVTKSQPSNIDVDKAMADVAEDVKKDSVKLPFKKGTKDGASLSVPAKGSSAVKVVKKTSQPKSYNEWKQLIADSTVKTHDPKLFAMLF